MWKHLCRLLISADSKVGRVHLENSYTIKKNGLNGHNTWEIKIDRFDGKFTKGQELRIKMWIGEGFFE